MRPRLPRDRDLTLVAGSVGVSAMGDWVALVALGLHVEDMTGSGFAISGLFICLWAPVVVLAGHVGLLVDRFETTRLLAVVGVLQAVVAVALGFAGSLGAVLGLAVVLGVGFAITQAAEFALVPAVVPSDRLHDANGKVETARYVGFTAGPLLGSLLTASGGVEIAMLVNAGTFVAVSAAALALRARRPPRALGAGAPKPRARDGVVALFATRTLTVAMAVAFGSLVFMSASIPADVLYVEEYLGMEDIGLGVILTLWTIGMMLGSLVVAKRIPAAALLTAALAGVVVQGLGKAVAPLVLSFGLLCAGFLVGGIGHGVKNVCFRTLIHRSVPEEAHGRAFAAYNGLRNGAELIALAAGGAAVAVLGARVTTGLAGALAALAGVVGLVLVGRLASDRVPEPAPAAADADLH